MKELHLSATLENLGQVIGFVEEELEERGCPMEISMQIAIAVEEIFVNIAHYAYHPEVGPATIRLELVEEPLEVIITFMDQGKPYDPLAREDPDITLGIEERQIGGLGIFMVKQTMDDVQYEYANGSNILKIKKRW